MQVGELPGGGSYIIMEFIEFGSSTSRDGQDSQVFVNYFLCAALF